MSTLQRKLVKLFAGLTGLNVARKGEGWKLMELETLSRFLSDFRVDCSSTLGRTPANTVPGFDKSDPAALSSHLSRIHRHLQGCRSRPKETPSGWSSNSHWTQSLGH